MCISELFCLIINFHDLAFITDLDKFAKYRITVTPFNEYGTGDAERSITVQALDQSKYYS